MQIEVWCRRFLTRQLVLSGHSEGVYSVELGRGVVVSGGEDGVVRVWDREEGVQLAALEHHSYIVWAVRLWTDRLVTASYDCTVVYLRLAEAAGPGEAGGWGGAVVEEVVQGPWEWADALYLEEGGRYLVVHEEETFQIMVWEVKNRAVLSRWESKCIWVGWVVISGC